MSPVRCDRCGDVLPSNRDLIIHLVTVPHKPREHIRPPIGTLVCVPDGGAAAVTGRIVRYDDDPDLEIRGVGPCVVIDQDDPTNDVWAYVEASQIVREN